MPKKVGPYGKLLANYQDDDAIIAAGEKAELLFCRALAFLSNADSDGYITDGQLERRVGAGMRDAKARAKALVEHGLWLRVDGGYQVRSYLKINDSAEEKGRKRRTDRERKRRDNEPESDPDSQRNDERNPSGVRADSLTGLLLTDLSGNGKQSSPVHEIGSAKPSTPDRFDEFWDVYPKHVAKTAARKRWDTRMREGVDPQAIITGAKAYAEEVRGKDPQFVKQPDGWLLAGRWEDEPPPSADAPPWYAQ